MNYNDLLLQLRGCDMGSCFFLGHRDAPDDLLPALEQEVERHITEYGVTEFTAGHYGRFDSLAARAVKKARERHSGVSLALLLPYNPAERPIETPEGFDCTFYPPGMEDVPRRLAILRADRYMIDTSDYLIAYAWNPGNARELLAYAQRREKRGLLHVSVLENPHN